MLLAKHPRVNGHTILWRNGQQMFRPIYGALIRMVSQTVGLSLAMSTETMFLTAYHQIRCLHPLLTLLGVRRRHTLRGKYQSTMGLCTIPSCQRAAGSCRWSSIWSCGSFQSPRLVLQCGCTCSRKLTFNTMRRCFLADIIQILPSEVQSNRYNE